MGNKRRTTKKEASSVSRKTTRTPRRVTTTFDHSKSNVLNDFFRLGESYTSLVLGIIVVIAVAALLVSFTKSRVGEQKKPVTDISSTSTVRLPTQADSQGVSLSPTLVVENIPTRVPAESGAGTETPQPTATTVPTKAPQATATTQPTATTVPTKAAAPTAVKATSTPQPQQNITGKTYVVKPGDDLWNIAVTVYGDGYQWTNVARANNLTDPNLIAAGTTLRLPERDASIPSSLSQTNPNTTGPPATYTVTGDENLWSIAVKEYGNGYRWVDIARANGLANPNLIHHGNVLKLPR